jgi:hypothetical protein
MRFTACTCGREQHFGGVHRRFIENMKALSKFDFANPVGIWPLWSARAGVRARVFP